MSARQFRDLPNDIADCVLYTFDNVLPQKFKPRQLANGQQEWVPLAGIVLIRDHNPTLHENPSSSLTCVALATGMKCLPQSKLHLAKGNILHDWHAEVLAMRAFNRWLVDECAALARAGSEGDESRWVKWSDKPTGQPFELKDNITIHMYCSEAPCGDASMELIMAEQPDSKPWQSPLPTTSADSEQVEMLGRSHFQHLGIVRRKPARPDAPISISKSCSDKLALKQVTGLLSGLAGLLVRPEKFYLRNLVLPAKRHVPTAVERAFGEQGRMASLAGKSWREGGGYAFRPFTVETTTREFAFSKSGASAVASNLSAIYTPHRQEVLIGGVLQGRKQLDPKGASCTSRRSMWHSVLEVAMVLGRRTIIESLRQESYSRVKESAILESRECVKQDARRMSLQGWTRNNGDDDWALESG